MKLSEIKSYLLTLSAVERTIFIKKIQEVDDNATTIHRCQQVRRKGLNNKQGVCPHCGHIKYVKFGSKSGSQRHKCKSCTRSFTEYTGTWMARIHHKNKIDEYLELMTEEKSLDKIKLKLSIHKKTAFDWRHKILSSISTKDHDVFTGITESDETFFLHSEKGRKVVNRIARKRGGVSSKRGINDDHIAVIVTQDRRDTLGFNCCNQRTNKKG